MAAGVGLADVVQQRGPAQDQIRALVLEVDRLPQHRQRVVVDVLVLVMFVDRHPHGADLGQHDVTQPGLHHEIHAGHGVGAQHQLVQLRGHALGGDPAELRRHLDEGLENPGRHREPQL